METTKRHTQAIVTTLVDFQKAQCYFAAAIQIAALVLISQIQSAAKQNEEVSSVTAPSIPDYLDAQLLVTISTSGLVPVIFTLTCIARYGRQSWYMILLALITAILSTGTLGATWKFWTAKAIHSSSVLGEQGFSWSDTSSCGVGYNLMQAGPLSLSLASALII